MASDTAERIEKFVADILPLSAADKLSGAWKRLEQWLVKHQDEGVPAPSQQKLMNLLEHAHKQRSHGKLLDPIHALYSTYLCLPEGKLTNGKLKTKVLKMLDEIASLNQQAGADGGSAASAGTELCCCCCCYYHYHYHYYCCCLCFDSCRCCF